MLPPRAVLTVIVLWAGLAPSSSTQRGGTAPTGGPREVWRIGANGHGRPVVGSGIVYFLSADHQVSALSAQTGRLVWSSRTGEPGQSTAGSAAALAGDTIVAGDYNLVAFDRQTGAFRWRFMPAIGYGPGIYLGDVTERVVLSGSPAGRIYAIHANSGELAWSQSVAGSAATTAFQPATDGRLVAAGYTVFQAPNAGGVAAFDLASGRELWRAMFPRAPDPLLGTGFGGGLLITPDEVIASSGDGTIYGLDRAGGSIRWFIPGVSGVPPSVVGPFPLPDTTSGADYRPLARVGTRMIAGSLKGPIVAYDLTTRRELWRYADARNGSVSFALAADARNVYVPFASGRHVALDFATGVERWRTSDPADLFNWPAAFDAGRVYLSGGKAYVAIAR